MFSQDQVDRYVDILKALSNPNRLKILLELRHCPYGNGNFTFTEEGAENCQQEFARMLGLSPSTVSHHFKELRNAGLLKVRREGKSLIIQVNTDVLDEIRGLF